MAARLNFSKFLKGTKKFITPTIPYLNRASIRNDVSIHSFCLSMYKENVPTVTSYGAQDILLSKIRSATDTWDILEAVNQHHSIMNNNHALQGLRSIFILQKSQSGCMSNGEVVNSPQFRLLANTLRSQIRHLDVNELIDSLKYLGYLGVPVTTKIMQTVLHLLSKHINELTLQQITFLDFLMKDFKNTPLVKALNIALPIVFEAHLLTMCDFKNVNQLTDLLIFVSRRPVHEKCCRIIIDALTEQRNNIDLKIAKSIIRSYCELKRENVKDELLLHHSLDVITDSVDNLPFYELEGILTRILSKHIYGYDYFYHEEFLNACGKYISNKNCNIEQGTWILRKLHRFNHVSLPLLDYLAEKVLKEPWTLEQAQAGVLISFIFGLAHADYKPQNWDRIKDLVIKCAEMHQDRQELPWIKFILDMCVMDCWSRPLIEKVFNEEFLKNYLSREYNTLDKLQLLGLHQCVSTLAPWTDGPSVPSKFLKSAIEINGTHHTNFPLLPALVHGLGDHSYVMNGVYTKFGHFIDHLIVMRKGGYPVAVNLSGNDQFTPNSKRKYVEDLDLPAETIKVAVLFLTPSMSSINNERIRGTVRLHVNTIEALGISVVPVLQTVWNTIMDSEKIPYLMQGIQLKANVVQPTTPIIVPV